MNPMLRRRTWLVLALLACGEEECAGPTDVDLLAPRAPPIQGGLDLFLGERALVGDSMRTEVRRWEGDGWGPPFPARDFAWWSSDTAVARVTPDGIVIATGTGRAQIVAGRSTAHDGTLGPHAELTVLPPSALQTLSVAPDSTTLDVGAQVRLTLYGRAMDGALLTPQARCASLNAAVATIDSTGIGSTCRVRSDAAGMAAITMTTNAGRSDTATVVVR